MTTTLSLSPLFRRSIGFDRFNDLFETMLHDTDNSNRYPPYDIVKKGDDSYTISMAVASFTQEDLTVTLENDRLIVSGKVNEPAEEGSKHLYRGIARRAFERVFRLADHMKVTYADLSDGLLHIDLVQEIPEEDKPRTIPISHDQSAKIAEKKVAA